MTGIVRFDDVKITPNVSVGLASKRFYILPVPFIPTVVPSCELMLPMLSFPLLWCSSQAMGPDSGTGRKGVGPAVGKVPKSTGGKGRQAVGRVVEKGKKEVKRMYEAVTKKRGRTKT
ncbi:hypothetical protein CONPUDRAFT_78517, partial [Coniophora puteana RWD-64-598 SS2]